MVQKLFGVPYIGKDRHFVYEHVVDLDKVGALPLTLASIEPNMLLQFAEVEVVEKGEGSTGAEYKVKVNVRPTVDLTVDTMVANNRQQNAQVYRYTSAHQLTVSLDSQTGTIDKKGKIAVRLVMVKLY